MVAGMLFRMRPAVGIEPDGGTMRTFGTVHVACGVVPGAFVRAGVVG